MSNICLTTRSYANNNAGFTRGIMIDIKMSTTHQMRIRLQYCSHGRNFYFSIPPLLFMACMFSQLLQRRVDRSVSHFLKSANYKQTRWILLFFINQTLHLIYLSNSLLCFWSYTRIRHQKKRYNRAIGKDRY